MSAPLLWIGVPFFLGLIMLLLRNVGKTLFYIAASISFILAGLARFLSIDGFIRIAGQRLLLKSTQSVLGRNLTLSQTDQPLLVFLFVSLGIWILLVLLFWQHRLFPGTAFAFLSMIIGAYAVETMLYSALIIGLALLFAIPILNPPGVPTRTGLKRMVIFQILAIPFFLMGELLLGSIVTNPEMLGISQLALALIGFAFMLWLGVFPFNSWMPQLAEESNPLGFGFVLSSVFTVLLLNLEKLIGTTRLIQNTEGIYEIIRLAAVFFIVVIGVFGFFQTDLRRMLAYIFSFQIAFSLLAIGLNTEESRLLLSASMLSRTLIWITATAAMASIGKHNLPSGLPEIAPKQAPFSYFAFLVTVFAVMGYPLMAGLPTKMEIMELLAVQNPGQIGLVLAGMGGFFLFGTKMLFELFHKMDGSWMGQETLLERIVLGLLSVSLLVVGVFPAQTLRVFLTFIQ
ncbi:MAG TPA: proton-conducting transporter membrane subunit [Bellilinea sp.]|nr:proton-conducting transporter membrane subunit [Bellilinea sp.]